MRYEAPPIPALAPMRTGVPCIGSIVRAMLTHEHARAFTKR